ncbi:type IV pilus assembly protein PilM [Candidatus Saccharibacteria bacterium]|nr:type IV pilus assembly protein PilM [Candidatus Saccharibacteria bacterium]MCB9821228.1 type IV pilus assembly protein PilM [Candidatus Nomurabacteria bacterium]
MGILSGISDFFGLDIGTGAIRVVQLHGSGASKTLVRYGASPLAPNLSQSDSPADQQQLAAALKDALSKHRITTRNVAVGLPSNRVFSTVVDIDKLPPAELGKTIMFQADSIIPTPIQDSKIDWAVIGESPKDPAKLELLVSSVANEFVERRLDLLENIGLNVIAFEPDNLAVARSMVAAGGSTGPVMIIDMGIRSTELVIVMNDTPKLSRSINTGSDAIIKSAMQGLAIDYKQAEQFVYKFGMVKDKLEGQVERAINPTIDVIISEIEKTIHFFENRYLGVKMGKLLATGSAAILPELPLHLANRFGVNVEIGNAWQNVVYPADRQNELMAVSNHFGVASGLAQRRE